MKYEFKATARKFLPLYVALVLVSAFFRITDMGNFDLGKTVSSLVLSGLFIALGILTFTVLVDRFNKNLLGDEGYLMFTLPVKTHHLITSKLIVSFIWSMLSGIIAFIAALVISGELHILKELFFEIPEFFQALGRYIAEGYLVEIICAPILLISIYAMSVLIIYLALAAAQLPIFIKHRGIISFVMFFVEIVVIEIITEGVYKLITSMNLVLSKNSTCVLTTIWFVVFAGVLFWLVNYILNKHLNLE